MNNVLTKEVNDNLVYFTNRGNEIRIVVMDKDEGEGCLIAQLYSDEIGMLNNGGILTIQNEQRAEIQHSVNIITTTIFMLERRIKLIYPKGSIELSFTNDDWDEIINFMVNGNNGKK